MLHSRSQGSRSKQSDRAPLPPVKPDNRQFETDLGNGFIRVDNGAPPARLPSESQPVRIGDLNSPVAAPPVPTVPAETTPAQTPAPVTRNLQPNNWQREFGLGKQV